MSADKETTTHRITPFHLHTYSHDENSATAMSVLVRRRFYPSGID